jgi:hypothetical protein
MQGAPLETPDTPLGIVSLELAYSKTATEKILEVWSAVGVTAAARTNIFLDFIFIPFYALLFYTLCGNIAVRSDGFAALSGTAIAFACLIAGLLDVCENLLMLSSLNGWDNAGTAIMTASIAWTKFALLAVASTYILLFGTSLLWRKYSG